MTFEEFFQKKKIDLKALGAERADLLKEFKQHFELMGEKSFDHTKKYWFNKLRRSYPLKESPKPVEKPLETASAGNSAPGEGKPASTAASKTATPGTGSTSAPKLGFKPRFKAGKTTNPAAKPQPASGSDTEKAAPKPAYKPRFKAGKTTSPAAKPQPASGENTSAEGSAGKNASAKPADHEAKPADDQTKPASTPSTENTGDGTTTGEQAKSKPDSTTPPKKPAYKPRFRPGVTKVQKKEKGEE